MDYYNADIILLGSDLGEMKKELFKQVYDPEQRKLITKTVLLNIFNEYKALILKGYKPLTSDKPLPRIHFTPLSWVTIKTLTKNTGLHPHFILAWCEALYKLVKTGKITYSNLNPKENEIIEGIKKFFGTAKIGIPVAIAAGVFGFLYLNKK